MAYREWRCLEAGCEYVVAAADEDTAVEAAMEHVRTAHGSFELEEMVLAALVERESVPDGLVETRPSGGVPRFEWTPEEDAPG